MSDRAYAVVDLGALGFEEGAHILLNRALARIPPGAELAVTGTDPALEVHLAVWCREAGHRWTPREHGATGPPQDRSPAATST